MILVGLDPNAGDPAPLEFAAELAELIGTRLVVACVRAAVPVVPIAAGQSLTYGVPDADLPADCSKPLEAVEPHLRAHGVEYECRQLSGLSAAHALQEEAEAERAAMIVVGAARPRGVERVVLGSTVDRLMHGAPCSVATVPPGWSMRPLREIGVAYVDTDEGRGALQAAHAFARRARATLRVVTVVHVTAQMLTETEASTGWRSGRDLDDIVGEHRALAERELRARVAELGEDVRVEVDALAGDPAEVLIELSERLDALMCGSRGYGPLRAVLLGGVSRRLAVAARCPVVVIPRGEATIGLDAARVGLAEKA
jgi:nucleotide-binding universal stress UspA family protein